MPNNVPCGPFEHFDALDIAQRIEGLCLLNHGQIVDDHRNAGFDANREGESADTAQDDRIVWRRGCLRDRQRRSGARQVGKIGDSDFRAPLLTAR